MEQNLEKGEYKATNIEEVKRRLVKEFDIEKVESVEEGTEARERKEVSIIEEEKVIREKLDKEVEMMRVSPQLQDDARKKAQQIKGLDAEGKLRGLLNLAQTKGLPLAVATARAMNDAYILDVFHDLLIKEGLYRRFSK